jgi:hypothetical protein
MSEIKGALLMQDVRHHGYACPQAPRIPLSWGRTAVVSELYVEIEISEPISTDLFHFLHYQLLLLHWMPQYSIGDVLRDMKVSIGQ